MIRRNGVVPRMNGVVVKNRFEPTASLAYTVRKQAHSLRRSAAITLNLASGGMNADAVDHVASVDGAWARCVDGISRNRTPPSLFPAKSSLLADLA